MGPIEERAFFRPLTIPLAKKLKKSRISPNHISLFGFIFAIISSIFILQNTQLFGIMAAITLYFSYFFDKLDGDLARAKKIDSKYGSWFEGFLDRLGEISITLSIIFITNEALLGALAISFPLLFCYYNEATGPIGTKIKTNKHKKFFGYTRGRHFLLLIILALINRLDIFLWIMSIGYIYIILLFLNKNRLFHKELK